MNDRRAVFSVSMDVLERGLQMPEACRIYTVAFDQDSGNMLLYVEWEKLPIAHPNNVLRRIYPEVKLETKQNLKWDFLENKND